MCLGVPVKVVRIDGQKALVELGGLVREAHTMLVPHLRVGDYVLLHAGFAIQVLDQAEAQQTLELLTKMAQEVGEET
ncbi:MAG: HypC/HybG/HupF family hydrogenase formation chaperone [Chloroflexota bacterium]